MRQPQFQQGLCNSETHSYWSLMLSSLCKQVHESKRTKETEAVEMVKLLSRDSCLKNLLGQLGEQFSQHKTKMKRLLQNGTNIYIGLPAGNASLVDSDVYLIQSPASCSVIEREHRSSGALLALLNQSCESWANNVPCDCSGRAIDVSTFLGK